MTAKEKAHSDGPYRILTLDGGGIRGAMSIEILAKIEAIAQKKQSVRQVQRQETREPKHQHTTLATGQSKHGSPNVFPTGVCHGRQ